jgi:hypothetical protein
MLSGHDSGLISLERASSRKKTAASKLKAVAARKINRQPGSACMSPSATSRVHGMVPLLDTNLAQACAQEAVIVRAQKMAAEKTAQRGADPVTRVTVHSSIRAKNCEDEQRKMASHRSFEPRPDEFSDRSRKY